jgi:hypothetical protein
MKKPSWRDLAYMTDEELRVVCTEGGIPVRCAGSSRPLELTREDLVEIIVLNHVKVKRKKDA